MTNKSQPSNPLGPIVTVQKRGLPVHVGIVDSNRLMAHGFDVDYPAKIHFRTLRHGPFSVLVATKSAVEVRVMMDGQLLCEQRLDPLPQPMRDRGEKSAVRRQVNENLNAPQPFFITAQNDGTPLTFVADPQGRSAQERLQLQLHPDQFAPAAEGPATVHRHEHVGTPHAKMDVDPFKLGLIAPPPAPVNNDLPHDGATEPGALTEGGSLADALSSDDGSSTANAPAQLVPASAQLPVDEHLVAPESAMHIDIPLPHMAPSYGMIAVGVRLVQVVVDGEPPQAPDGFDWVLFQVNTWEDHARVRANLHSRIQMPPKVPYREIDDGTQVSDTHTVHGSGCGCSHGHNPRRFR
jgi:hypothetical protein